MRLEVPLAQGYRKCLQAPNIRVIIIRVWFRYVAKHGFRYAAVARDVRTTQRSWRRTAALIETIPSRNSFDKESLSEGLLLIKEERTF